MKLYQCPTGNMCSNSRSVEDTPWPCLDVAEERSSPCVRLDKILCQNILNTKYY